MRVDPQVSAGSTPFQVYKMVDFITPSLNDLLGWLIEGDR